MWKNYVWNPITCSCENGKYLTSIIVGSEIICNEVIDAEAKSNDEVVSICCYLIKFWAKQIHLLSFQFTINKLKEIIY